MIKITHLTSAHPRHDIRIFVKQCCSLAQKSDYYVSLIVADGLGYEEIRRVKIHDAGFIKGRLNRMINTSYNVFLAALELDSDIYHLHDPELIPYGLILKLLGKKVIFDAHEDLPKQILGKPYLKGYVAKIISKLFRAFENVVSKRFDAIISATPLIEQKFSKLNPTSVNINNYPILGELLVKKSWQEKENEVCYVGIINQIRGIKQVVKSLEHVEGVRLNLVGKFTEESVELGVKSYSGWKKVNEFGFLNREEVKEILGRSKMGIVTFLPLPNHIDAQPNKMFEYMSAGLPIITSNFPLWREIVDGCNCGICVDPRKPEEIANAIKYLLANPKEAENMGSRGKEAVFSKYNWNSENEKLSKLYRQLLEGSR